MCSVTEKMVHVICNSHIPVSKHHTIVLNRFQWLHVFEATVIINVCDI